MYQYLHGARVLFDQMRLLFKRMMVNRKATLITTFGMILNNILFFCIWILLFQHVPTLKGWELSDVAMMYGLGATCFGLSGAFLGGYRLMADHIRTGQFDAYLGKPISPMILSLTSFSTAHALGDALTGPLFWLFFCDLTSVQVMVLVACSIAGAAICAAIGVMIYSLAFWLDEARTYADTLLYFSITFLTTPLHGMPYWVKVLLFTVFPIGFVSYLPVEIAREPSMPLVICCFLGAVWAFVMARVVFYMGLKRYSGASGIRSAL